MRECKLDELGRKLSTIILFHLAGLLSGMRQNATAELSHMPAMFGVLLVILNKFLSREL